SRDIRNHPGAALYALESFRSAAPGLRTTARAKGLSEEVVIGRHALKNALIPVVTIIAVTMPRVVGGSTVVETVFAYPGMGRLLYTSIMGNDYVVAMTVVMIIAMTVIFFNLFADILYGWLDPRIRYQN